MLDGIFKKLALKKIFKFTCFKFSEFLFTLVCGGLFARVAFLMYGISLLVFLRAIIFAYLALVW